MHFILGPKLPSPSPASPEVPLTRASSSFPSVLAVTVLASASLIGLLCVWR